MQPSVDAILKKLESLSRQDRRWVIKRLPDSVKSVLLSGQGNIHQSEPVKPLYRCSPAAIAHVLAGEPGWIIEVLLRDGDAAWRKQVLLHLPPVVRTSVTALLHSPTLVSRPVLDSLLRSVRQKLDAAGSINPMPNDRSRWQRWVELRTLRARIRL